MGNLQAQEFAGLVEEGVIDLDVAIQWHLFSNIHPPIDSIMVKPCIEAIDNANAGEWDKLVSLPEGVGYRGLTVAPTSAIIEGHRLEAFLGYED